MISFVISFIIAVLFVVAVFVYKKLSSSSVSRVSKNDAFCKIMLNYNPVIITGTQGTGKTTLAISFISYYLSLNPAAKFFHCGLDEGKIGESFSDYEHWQDLPENSIIYIDECDKNGFANSRYTDVSKLPAHLRALTELRHKGHHLILSTVNVMDIHYHARNLCPGWVDLSRVFGLKRAQATLRPGWKDIKKLSKDQQKNYKSETIIGKAHHDEEMQKLFKSSSIHTTAYQTNIPWRSILFYLALILGVVVLVKYTFFSLSDPFKKQEEQKKQQEQQQGTQPASSTGGGLLSLVPNKSSLALTPQTQAAATTEPTGPVKLFTDKERAQYSVPAFMSDLDFVTYFEGGGYRCSSSKIGRRSSCFCNWTGDNVGKANVSSDTCYSHVATRLYPHLSSATKVASNN